MPRGVAHQDLTAFNGGEWSPKLFARTDQAKYMLACRMLKNYTLFPYGGADRRFGLEYIDSTKFPGRKARLLPFRFSVTTNFTLEVGHQYMRFYSNGIMVTSGGSPVELVTPWEEDDLFQIQLKEINDLVFFTHPLRHPQLLTRFSDIMWTIEDVPWVVPPLLDENITSTTIAVSVLTGSGTATASAAIFNAQHVGAFWAIGHRRAAQATELILQGGSGVSTTVVVPAGLEWNFLTTGRWGGTVEVQALDPDTGLFETIREFKSVEASLNIDTTGTEDVETTLRIEFTDVPVTTPGADPARAHLNVPSTIKNGIVKVTAFNSTTSVDVDVIEPMESTAASSRWSEGAFSEFRGHPRALEVYEDKLVFAGTFFQPRRLFLSKTGEYRDFRYGTLDDDAFRFDVQGDQSNQIQWMVSQRRLMVGTAGAEYAVGAGREDDPITPSDRRAKLQSAMGSRFIQALVVNDVILFTQRNGKKVRELVYSYEKENYVAPDMTLLAEHITGSGIVQVAYAQQPDQIFWCVTEDGQLIGMTYEREQGVTGWHRHETQGLFESVAVTYGAERDEVWCVVKRELPDGVGGFNTVRYVERIRPTKWETKDECFFVDAGLSFPATALITAGSITTGKIFRIVELPGGAEPDFSNVGGPAVGELGDEFTTTSTGIPNDYAGCTIREVFRTFGGLDHLEGLTVQILADGAVDDDQIVTNGEVTLSDELTGYIAHVGLGYDSFLQPMRLDVNRQLGVNMGTTMRLRQVVIRFLETLGVEVGVDEDSLLEEPFDATDRLMDQSGDLFSDDKVIDVDGGYGFKGDVLIAQRQPLPSTILALIAKYEVSGW